MSMKQEDGAQTPTTTFSAAQWGNQIPIDPALQQQSQPQSQPPPPQYQPQPQAQAQAQPQYQVQQPAQVQPQYQAPPQTQPQASYQPQPQAQPQTQYQPHQPQTQPQHQAVPQHTTTPQYSHYQAYQQYAQHSYSHYQYQPAQTTQQAQMATIPTAPKPVIAAAPPTSTLDTTDVTKLNDALGSAGVDLRAEEESLHRSFDQYQSYRPYEDRSRKQPPRPNFDARIIGQRIRDIGAQHKVTKVPEDSVNYLALALRARLQDLVEGMIDASAHRADTQFDRPASQYEDGKPMWSILIRADISKQLAAIERVEREEETRVRRERKERIEMAAAQAAALAAQQAGNAMAVDGDLEDGQPKKKKKKADGPGVTARNMSEDVRKKMSNAVASQAAGLGTKYAWMNTSVTGNAAKAKAAAAAAPATPTASSALSPATTTAPATSAGAASTWARPYISNKPTAHGTASPDAEDKRRSITLRDAMFVLEKERGHGGGRGSAKGWT
ncbi:TAF4 domain-containing protein [Phanerochaete sordida]|uniref:Transcription initiation factor TFIID subunit 4 n=1 Tax=Phanerochaete sordida TaxID=48140 RepID=A0A9P3G3G5_9APHY|nr:TAF4 domain-containing protein [Phanerochaete sordida]